MFNNFEKSITFIANLIAIITFGLSIFNWLGFGFIAEASIPTERAAKCILCLYCCLASYGQSKALDEQARKDENILLLWFLLSFSYAFGFLFLLEKSKTVLSLSKIDETNTILFAWLANVFLMFAGFFYRRIYPKGGVIAFLKNYFQGLRATFFWFSHAIAIGIIFFVLR